MVNYVKIGVPDAKADGHVCILSEEEGELYTMFYEMRKRLRKAKDLPKTKMMFSRYSQKVVSHKVSESIRKFMVSSRHMSLQLI